MEEYISRKETLENLKKFAPEHITPLIEQLVMKQPAADVVEVKHGYWKKFEIPHMMRCSECGVSDLDIHRKKFAFCPYCGAKMDGRSDT